MSGDGRGSCRRSFTLTGVFVQAAQVSQGQELSQFRPLLLGTCARIRTGEGDDFSVVESDGPSPVQFKYFSLSSIWASLGLPLSKLWAGGVDGVETEQFSWTVWLRACSAGARNRSRRSRRRPRIYCTPVLLACAIGIIAGLRSLTAPAVVSWAARLRWPQLQSTPLAFMEMTAVAYLFTLLAAGELIADKLPFTPSRLSAGPLAGRLILGALCGSVLQAVSHQSLLVGAVLGGLGGLLGSYLGYTLRNLTGCERAPTRLGVALAEDVIAIGGALAIVSSL